MNKRFLVGALLVALSTAGFAAGTDYAQDCTDANTNIGALNTEILNTKNQFTALKGEINGKLDNTYTKEEADNKFATKGDVANGIQSSIDAANGVINQVEQDLNNKINEKADASNVYNKEEVNQKVTDTLQGALGYTDSAITEVENKLNEKANKTDVENALSGKVDKDTFYDAYNEFHLGQTFTDETLKTHREQIEDLDKNKVDQSTYEEDKKVQADKDAEQDAAIALGDRVNNVQNQQIGALQTENIEQNNKIEALDKNKVDKNTYEEDKKAQADKDAAQDAAIALGDRVNNVQNQQIGALQTENIEQNNKIEALDKNKVDKDTYEEDKKAQADKDAAQDAEIAKGDRINGVQNQQIGALQTENVEQNNKIEALDKNKVNKADQEKVDSAQNTRLDTLENNYAQYDGRLSGLEKKVDHLDDKMNKGLSLMAAMNAVDFQNVQTGEMALGAGIGHYGNAQSVALGVAYAPVEDLTVNAKYSITAGDPDSFAVGAGATYKFKVGR